MAKSKIIILIFAVLVLLFAAVSFSGCLGNDAPEGNVTTPPAVNETEPPEGNVTTPPEGNVTAPPATPSVGSVRVIIGGNEPTPTLVQTRNQRFPQQNMTLNINVGDTIGIRNNEDQQFRHLFRSEENAFEDFTVDRHRRAALTFNEPGTYRIQLLNHHTGEPFGTGPAPVLTVIVT